MSTYQHLVFEPDAVVGHADLLRQGMQTVLKYGKYKDQSIEEVVVTSDGRSYLKWMIRPESNFKESLQEKIRVVLSFAEERLRKA